MSDPAGQLPGSNGGADAGQVGGGGARGTEQDSEEPERAGASAASQGVFDNLLLACLPHH